MSRPHEVRRSLRRSWMLDSPRRSHLGGATGRRAQRRPHPRRRRDSASSLAKRDREYVRRVTSREAAAAGSVGPDQLGIAGRSRGIDVGDRSLRAVMLHPTTGGLSDHAFESRMRSRPLRSAPQDAPVKRVVPASGSRSNAITTSGPSCSSASYGTRC